MTNDFDPPEAPEEAYETAAEILARDNIYGEIKRALVARGIPAEENALIHDYPTPAKKAKVFAEGNAGKIRVLIGSTEKKGVGAKFLERVGGLQHLNPRFPPAESTPRQSE